jgi:hypothetical protein
MTAWNDRIYWGVIEDARCRHGRERRSILAAVVGLAVSLAVVLALVTGGGGGGVRYSVPAPGRVTGLLRQLSPADYQYWATPTLLPGEVSLDILVQDAQGSSRSCIGGCANYVGAGEPVGQIDGYGGIGPTVGAPLPAHSDPDYVLSVPSDAAAVRVGSLGTVGAQSTRGLPSGDKVVAFKVPQTASPDSPRSAPAQTLTVLDARGHAIATLKPQVLTTRTRFTLRALARKERRLVTTHGGRCAVTPTLAGLTAETSAASTTITAIAPSTPGLLLSCLEDKYVYRGARFNVAILLNAHHPGAAPAALWNSRPVPGQPGVVDIAPPSGFPANEDASAPIYARRTTNAWLVVQARPGFATSPTPSERIRVLDNLRITRLDLGHA